MLLHIPKILTPELLKKMCEMGHCSEMIIADANFPAYDCVSPDRIIHIPSVGNTELLEAVLQYFPLDSYGENLFLMTPDPGWDVPPIWQQYREIAHRLQPVVFAQGEIDRLSFYRRAEKAYVIVVTGEQSPYANILLVKGVIQ